MNTIAIEGTELVIRVNLAGKPIPSKSGKSLVIDSTQGFVRVSTPLGTCSIGLNVVTSDENWGLNGRTAPQPAPTLVKTNGNGAGNGVPAKVA